ncbi:hypothetical protein D9M72_579250 [compost metagenome]
MKALQQVGRRREGPRAVVGHFGRADLGAVVADDDGVAWRALAVEAGLAVVGHTAGGDGVLDVAGVVEGAAHDGGRGCEGGVRVVDGDLNFLGGHGVSLF